MGEYKTPGVYIKEKNAFGSSCLHRLYTEGFERNRRFDRQAVENNLYG